MTAAYLYLLSIVDEAPAWLLWSRPARVSERAQHGIDIVITVDLEAAAGPLPWHPSREDRGILRLGFAVRWNDDDDDQPAVACWHVRRGAPPEAVRGAWMVWLRDVRRDFRRRHASHGTSYTERIHILDPRERTHAPRT